MHIDLIQTGDILHCRGKRLLSRMIMRFTKSAWSHTALAVRIDNALFVIDAQKDGVNLRPFEAWHKEYNYEFLVHRSQTMIFRNTIQQRALSKVGHTAYDFVSLIARQPIELISGKWKERKDPTRKMYCSEFVAWVYAHPKYYSMSPEDVFQWCMEREFIEIYKNH